MTEETMNRLARASGAMCVMAMALALTALMALSIFLMGERVVNGPDDVAAERKFELEKLTIQNPPTTYPQPNGGK